MNNEIQAFINELNTAFHPVKLCNYSTDLTPVDWPEHWILGIEYQRELRK